MVAKLDLAQAAAEYAAGELSSAECVEFETHLRANPALADEVTFWRQMRGDLQPVQALTPGTCPDLAQSLLRRARLERAEAPARRLRLPRWVMVVSAAAACLTLGLGFAAGSVWSARPETTHTATLATNPTDVSEIPATEPLAYGEDGSSLTPPPATVAWRTYLPLAAIDHADANRPLPMTPVEKPWIGLWTRQARLVITGAPAREAHLVVRIVGNSPAWQAGLRPGDMIIAIDQCTVEDARCLGMHLANSAPGGKVVLDYWSAEDAAFRTATVTLEAVHE